MRQFSVGTLYSVSAFIFPGVVEPTDSAPTGNTKVQENAALSCELRNHITEKTIITQD